MNTQITAFLEQNPALALSALEKEAGLSKGLLGKVQRGERQLNDKHLEQLLPVLTKYGFSPKEGEKATVIAIVNHKGGVSKTTTALNLGAGLAKKGMRVLLVDGDAQGNLSQNFGIFEVEEHQLVDAMMDSSVPLPAYGTEIENLWLCPSDLELAEADMKLTAEVGSHNILNEVLQPVLADFDYIVIDCPPALNIITYNALTAADECIIPLQPESHAVKGLDKILGYIEKIRSRVNEDLKVGGVLFTIVDNRLSIHKYNMDMVRHELGEAGYAVFESTIRRNVAVTEAQHEQKNIFEYAPGSNGAKDYEAFINEVIA